MNIKSRITKVTKLLKASGTDSVLALFSAPLLRRNNDVAHSYRQLSNFLYLTNSKIQDCALLLFDNPEKNVLLQRKRSSLEAIWDGDITGAKPLAAQLGVGYEIVENVATRTLEKIRGCNRIYLDEENQSANKPLTEALLFPVALNRKSLLPGQIHSAREILSILRSVKDRSELAHIRRAIAHTRDIYLEFCSHIRPGLTERELNQWLRAQMLLRGLEPSFETIVATGPSAATLHHTPAENKLRHQDFVLLDFGMEDDSGYGSDITRCTPVNRERMNERAAHVYEIVQSVLEHCQQSIKANMPVKKLQSIAIEELTYGLVELGVLKGKVSALIEKKAYEPYFPHGIGHSLGLDVHDITPEPFLLKPGTVLTVEPGLYFNAHTLNGAAAKRYQGIGIRLENNVHVTSRGAEILSDSIPFL